MIKRMGKWSALVLAELAETSREMGSTIVNLRSTTFKMRVLLAWEVIGDKVLWKSAVSFHKNLQVTLR